MPRLCVTSLCGADAGIRPFSGNQEFESRLLFGSAQSAIDPFIQLGTVPAESSVAPEYKARNRIAAPVAAHFPNPTDGQV